MKELSDILNGDEVFALLEDSKSEDGDSNNLFFTGPQESIIAWNEEELPAALAEIEALKSSGLYLCGFLSYEAGYHFIDKKFDRRSNNHTTQPLLYFTAFKQLQTLSRKMLDDCFAEINAYPESELCPHNFNVSVSKRNYLEAIQSIGGYLNSGDGSLPLGETSQINYSIKYRFDLQGNAISLYKALRKTQPVEFGAVLNFTNSKIVSVSPELLVSKKDDVFTPDLLEHDPKSLTELMHDLFPSSSVTGEPKVSAMEIINELEAGPRGIYAGSIGYLLPNDDFCFSVATRSIDVDEDNRCVMGISSGILDRNNIDKHDGDENKPQAKYEECLLDGSFLSGINKPFHLIETFKFDGDTQDYKNLSSHLERLCYSASYFGFVLKKDAIQNKLAALKEQLTAGSYKVRLTAFHSGESELTHELLPEDDDVTDGDEKMITLGHQKIDSKSLFQYHKTSRREVYNEEYDKAVKEGFYEAIIFNEHNEIAEACRHNIFVKRNGKWYTPPLSAGALDGIERQNFKQKTEAIDKYLTLDQIQYCEEIVLTNSVRGEVRVKLDKTIPIPENLGISVHSINLDEYLAIKDQSFILDVRLLRDYEESEFTLPNSEWKDPTLIDEWIRTIPKDKKVVVYCVHGRTMSETITERLLAEGIDATFIQSGIEGIRESGVEVVKSDSW